MNVASKKEWQQMSLEEKRQTVLRHLQTRSKIVRGIAERKEVLKQIYITNELDMPEIESYLERIYQDITGGNEC